MKPETFFENFGHLADSPNGIQKLRELILQLAVSGRLSTQDPNDEPASILLEKITKEKKRRIALNDFNASKVEDRPFLESVFSLPANWIRCQIADICELKTGATPSRNKKEFFGGNIKWLVSGDINQGTIFDCKGRITEEGMDNSNCKLLSPNSILIALNGQGKTRATVAILKTEATCNQSLVAMLPILPRCLVPEYVFWNLRGKYRAIRDITGQKQRRGLNMKLVGSLSLELPPLAEQNRIVAKVEKLMAVCDELEVQQKKRHETRLHLNNSAIDKLLTSQTPKEFTANWQRICDNFGLLYDHPDTVENLRQAILQLAVQGKLIPQDPKDEPAKYLLEKIKIEKEKRIKQGKLKKQTPLPSIKEDEIQFTIPKSWKWTRLNDVYDVRDGTHDTPKYVSNGVPLITSKDFKKGEIDFANAKLISEIDHNLIKKRSLVEKEDVLFSMIGGNIGNMVLVTTSKEFSIKNVALFKYYDKSLTLPRYLTCFLKYLSEHIQSKAFGGAQPFVSLTYLRNYPFPLPPLNEQKRIIAKVDQLMALCDQLRTQLKEAQETSAKLTAAAVANLTASA